MTIQLAIIIAALIIMAPFILTVAVMAVFLVLGAITWTIAGIATFFVWIYDSISGVFRK